MQPPFTAYQGEEPYIFVSYAHEDSGVVYPEIQWLKDQGFNLWFDEGISPGHAWRTELGQAIEKCSLFLFFVTPTSVASAHCEREVNYAMDQNKPLLVVHLEATQLPTGLGMSLSSIQAVMRHELSDLDYRIKLLGGVSNHLSRGIGNSAPLPRAGITNRSTILLGLVLLLVGVALGVLIEPMAPTEVASPQSSKHFLLGNDEALLRGNLPLAISDDGTTVYFAGENSSGHQLFSRSLAELTANPISGTEEFSSLVSFILSADGRELVFSSLGDNSLYRISIAGGIASVVMRGNTGALRNPTSRGLSLGPGDSILFAGAGYPGLMKVAMDGGTPEHMTDPADGIFHWAPHFSPVTNSIFFTSTEAGMKNSRVTQLLLDTGEIRDLIAGGSPYLTPDSILLFLRENQVWATRFDPQKNAVTGNAVPVLNGITRSEDRPISQYAISPTGNLVYWNASSITLERDLVWVDFEGRENPFPISQAGYRYPRISPSGDQIAVQIEQRAGAGAIWIYATGEGALTRLTFEAGSQSMPEWSPSSDQIIYSSMSDDNVATAEIYLKSVNGGGQSRQLTDNNLAEWATQWTPDGLEITYGECGESNLVCRVIIANIADPTDSKTLGEKSYAYGGVLSPDNKWFAYETMTLDTNQIYVRPYADLNAGTLWQVSRDGGVNPRWGPDGNRIYFYQPSGRYMMVADITTEPTFKTIGVTRLFNASDYEFDAGRNWTVDHPNNRFLMVKPTAKPQLVMVDNWFAELERLLPRVE